MTANEQIEQAMNRAFRDGWTIQCDGLAFTIDEKNKVLRIAPRSAKGISDKESQLEAAPCDRD